MAELSYWERRQVQNMYEYMQQAEDTSDQIAKIYLKASRYLSIEADEIFEKYQTKHKLSEQEAMQLINAMQDKTSIAELVKKLKLDDKNEHKKGLVMQLEAPAYRARIERLEKLQNQLDYVMANVYQQEKAISTSHYVNLASEVYYHGTFDIQQRAGAAYSVGFVDTKMIDQVINSKWSGENYSARIWHNTKALAQDLKEELLINLVTGRTNREAAEIISTKFGVGASKARRLVRTESNFLAAELNFKAYEEAGIEKYKFLATLDLRTSKMCRGLDGQIFLVSERKTGVNCNPMHPWCRSTTISVISEELLNRLQRSTRDPATGKQLKVPMSMNYNEWYDKYVKSNPKAEAEERKVKNYYSDKKQWEKYKTIRGDNVPDRLDKFQDMKYNELEKWKNLKSEKQSALNALDFSNISSLKGKLGNKEVRLWYKSQDAGIPSNIDRSVSLKEQAMQAHGLRNKYRTQARELMKDQVARKELDSRHPNISFREMVEYKMKRYGLTEQDAYNDIIRSSATTNKRYDKLAGIGDDNQ